VFPELSFAVTVLGVKLVQASTCWFVRGVTSNLNTPGVGGVTGGTGGVGGVTGGTGVEGVEGICGVDGTDAQIIFKTIASGAESAIQSFA